MNKLPNTPIGVLIVDDSPFMRMTLQKILSQDPDIKVLDIARDGSEGIEKIQALRPQVVTMDVEMPIINGLQALDEIMRWQPTPVIILSAVTTEGAEATLKALDLGAFDVVAKPSGGPGADLKALTQDIIEKVKAAAQINPARLGKKGLARFRTRQQVAIPFIELTDSKASTNLSVHNDLSTYRESEGDGTSRTPTKNNIIEVVAIGTSTGGPSALQTVIPQLPADFPVPVLVAQHMPPGFTAPLAQRLNGLSSLNVREGVDGEVLKPGTVYVAPAGKQTQVIRKSGQLTLSIGDESPIPTLYHPSIDVLFMSLAKEVGKGTLGVIMTGMGTDGTKGMREIKKLEGLSIAEAEESCVVYGMPRSVVEAGLADKVVNLNEIGKTINEYVIRR